MSFSGREYKAQQRRISDTNRRVNLKARFQKQKDKLRAEQRLERRQRREAEIRHTDCATEESEYSESDSDTDCAEEEAGQRDPCSILSLFLVFIVVSNLLIW